MVSFEGACGVYDGTDGEGSVEFRVMSGSGGTVEFRVMKRGMHAKKFYVKVAANGLKNLYLMADRVENNSYDHADWVDLAWRIGKEGGTMQAAVMNVAKFGMIPGVRKDQGPALAPPFPP